MWSYLMQPQSSFASEFSRRETENITLTTAYLFKIKGAANNNTNAIFYTYLQDLVVILSKILLVSNFLAPPSFHFRLPEICTTHALNV